MSDGEVIGTIALMMKQNKCAVMKKFFVKKEFRSQKIGLALYNMLIEYAKEKYIEHIILDTPSVAAASHRFYEKAVLNELSRRNYLYRTVFQTVKMLCLLLLLATGDRSHLKDLREKRLRLLQNLYNDYQ